VVRKKISIQISEDSISRVWRAMDEEVVDYGPMRRRGRKKPRVHEPFDLAEFSEKNDTVANCSVEIRIT